ncbi:Holliday junction ATP-dependent DNA helicase RuvB [Erysipelothrix rhusiopathiae SY1027]|nr:Holliday junction ATP-dependent DNA helicase RuvB [Erysipelothrix rhusiopathiae SY1027]
MEERLMSGEAILSGQDYEESLRPQTLSAYVGQEGLKEI